MTPMKTSRKVSDGYCSEVEESTELIQGVYRDDIGTRRECGI